MRHTTLLSHADLLQCLKKHKKHGFAHIAAWAQALGYVPQPLQSPDPPPPEPTTVPEPSTPALLTPEVPAERSPRRFPRVVQYQTLALTPEQLDEPLWYRDATPWPEDDPALSADPHAVPLPQLPLMPWSRLWPLLKAVLSVRLESTQLDLPPLVQRLARGEMPRRLPRRTHQSWAATCQVLIDFAEPLTPFWDDFHTLRQRLAPLRGVSGLSVLAFPEGDPEGPCLVWSPTQHAWLESAGYTLPAAGTPVLVLSDLGCHDTTGARRQPWRRLGQRLRQAGCQPMALMPCPPRCWVAEVTQWFAPLCWDREARRVRRPRPWRGHLARRTAQDQEADAMPLLQALGVAVRIEPAVLRAVRYLLPGADVGSEAAAWQHPHVHVTPLAAYYEPEEVAGYRQAFAQLDATLRQEVAGVLRRYHAHLSPVIRHEEQRLLEASGSVLPSRDTAMFLARLVHNLRTLDGALAPAARAWVDRMTRRQYAAVWQSERLVALWVAAHLEQLKAGDALTVPEGLDPDKAAWLLRGMYVPQHYTLRQRGLQLCIEIEAPASVLDVPGSLLGRLSTARPFVRVQAPHDATPKVLHPLGQALPLPLEGGLRLRTEYQEICIESQPRPAWASGMGQDQHGLFITWAARQRRAYWVPPGVYPVTDTAGQALGQRSIEQGFWCDVAEALELLQAGFRQPLWAEAYGLDEYGLYADWSVRGVTQRMRWIAPGRFMMGSPESEPDHLDNETLHAVLLTRGFWLADTACTQALWQAVTGKNPSSRRGEEHPVENVSWNDIQAFLQRLNTVVTGEEFRLPTEAEWEYACRAGTTTPFWFGEQITSEQVNYGYGSRGTVPVKALLCNNWGLYQMHSNVWEWCQDWYAEYAVAPADAAAEIPGLNAEHAVVDPIGPAAGGSRVLRGGGWIDHGRGARSARRFAFQPGFRHGFRGFRLARGQASPADKVSETPAGSGARRAGQTQRSGVGQARRVPRQRSKK
jgi:formylglycine-generating enzyme required for sulfatase activity